VTPDTLLRWYRQLVAAKYDGSLPLGERHLRNLISEYVAHYHGERNHQGLGNRLIEPLVANTNSGKGVIVRHERLGGILNWYCREAV
jgi:putative transposase